MSFLFSLQNYISNGRLFQPKPMSGIVARESFRRLIELERERSGRNKAVFSLILLEAAHHQTSLNGARDIYHKLTPLLRNVDVIGWFDNKHIGILLPYTTREGAYRLVRRISETLGSHNDIACDIFSYPDRRIFESKGD